MEEDDAMDQPAAEGRNGHLPAILGESDPNLQTFEKFKKPKLFAMFLSWLLRIFQPRARKKSSGQGGLRA